MKLSKTKYFYDIEQNEIISSEDLYSEFTEQCDNDDYNEFDKNSISDFIDFIESCMTQQNGNLIDISDALISFLKTNTEI